MPPLTRCPNCHNHFDIDSISQLANDAERKTRCPRCAFDFDAVAHIVDAAAVLAVQAASETSEIQESVPAEAFATTQASAENSSIKVAPIEAQSIEVESSEVAPIAVPTETQSTETTAPKASTVAEADDDLLKYQPIFTAEDEALLRVPERPSALRMLWLIPAFIALLLLVGQIIYRYHTDIAIQVPNVSNKLARFCRLTGCQTTLPARAEWLHTDWSELNFAPDRPNIIQVNATLRNQATFEQALPLMKLTLTDETNRIVAKRIFAPREYLVPLADGTPAPVPASLGANGELLAFLQLDLSTLRSSAYTIDWIYPQRH